MPESYLSDADCTLYHGDALDVLRELPSESVHCIATSPPFYALRDYGTGRWEGGDAEHEHDRVGARGGRGGSGTLDKRCADAMPATVPAGSCSCGAVYVDPQIGLESTPEEWAQKLVEVFREARRVLRSDGSMFVEVGDSFAGSWGNQGRKDERGTQRPINGPMLTPVHDDRYPDKGSNTGAIPDGTDLKPKDLMGTPWLLAFALRADGWWLRGCNIWAKPNAMPESAKDRCTTAHSYVFHFAKSARYYFDGDAIREVPAAYERKGGTAAWTADSGHTNGIGSPSFHQMNPDGAHPRSVWTIPTQGFPEAHFATWPEALARRIILAGCPEQVCSVCGEARMRIVEKTKYEPPVVEPGVRFVDESRGDKTRKLSGAAYNAQVKIIGESWTDCGHNAYVPGTVLDPFAGSGTTLYVARKLGRRGIGIDLNAEYLKMAARRLQQQSLFAEAVA